MTRYPTFSIRRMAVSAIVLLLSTILVHAEHLPVKTYTIADGLARDFINRIKQDSHGLIWFCTAEGISRFDGYDFTNYGVADGLPHRVVNDILIMQDGTYLFGTERGLVQFDPAPVDSNSSHFTLIKLVNDKVEPSVESMVEDPDGSVWLGTSHGVFQLSGSRDNWRSEVILKDPATDEPVSDTGAIFLDISGALWIGTGSNGVFRYRRGHPTEHYKEENGLAQNGISCIFQDRGGTIWIGTGTGLTRVVDSPSPSTNVSARNYTTKDGLLNHFIETIFQSSDGRIWIGTRGGVSYLSDPDIGSKTAFRNFGPSNGLPNIRIISFCEDQDRNLWIGGENGGALKIPINGFVSYLEEDGFGNGRISQIFGDRHGSVYALASESSTLRPVILRYEAGKFIREVLPLPADTLMTWGWNQLIAQDSDLDWWIPTSKSLFRVSGGPNSRLTGAKVKETFSAANGVHEKGIFRLYIDSKDDVWFTTLDDPIASLHKYERSTGKIIHFPWSEERPRSAVTAYAESRDGDLWLGFYTGGIVRVHDGRMLHYSEADGLPPGFIRNLFFDSKDRLWIGTSIGGGSRVDNINAPTLQFENITTKNGIASDQVTTITEDKFGRIYIGTGRGIDRMDPDTRKVKHFTTADGLPDNFINASYADKDGVLWFGTLHGLARFVPEPEVQRPPPPILISGIRVAGVKQPIAEFGQTEVNISDLRYTENQIEIAFLSVGFSAGETLRYQYKFEDSDANWSEPSEQRTITLPNLPSGSYRFLVRAINSDGLFGESPAVVNFRILPPIWARWWFIATCFLLFGGLVIGFFSYRTARLRDVNVALEDARRAEEKLRRSQEERLNELENVRSRIATDLHDDIGASLTQIAVLSEVAQSKAQRGDTDAQVHLSKITDVSNELVGTMSDIVWSINPAKDHLSDLSQRMRRFAADLLASSSIRFHFQGNDDVADTVINSNLRREVFLIFKESINNVVKHSGAKNVWAELNVVAGNITLTIRDDGSGFDTETADIPRTGNGLSSMRRRSREMGGVFDVQSQPGEATTVIVSFPVDKVS